MIRLNAARYDTWWRSAVITLRRKTLVLYLRHEAQRKGTRSKKNWLQGEGARYKGKAYGRRERQTSKKKGT